MLLPIVGAVLAIIGLWLLKRGQWPRRIGRTRHCRVCNYILTEDQEKCSECGTVVSKQTVVYGERHRRPVLALSGTALSLIGLGLVALFVSGVTRTIDLNDYKPLGWLLRDLDNPASSGPAWAEIQRRLNEGHLSESDQEALVDKSLKLQAAGTALIAGSNPLDFVGQRFLDHKLTRAQADQFFAAAFKVKLAVRSVVGTQSLVPYSIAGLGRGPGGWWLRMRQLESQIDDGPIQRMGGGTGGSFGGWTTSGTLPPVGKPGKHRLRVKVELATDATGGVSGVNWDDNAPVARKVTQDLFADFQEIEGQTPIATVTAPSPAVLSPLFTPRLTYQPSNSMHIETGVDAGPLPVNVAFNMFVRFGGREFPVGSVSFRKGAPGGYATGTTNSPADPPQTVDMIFRSSEDVARGTMDMMTIWKGEIVIPNVTVARPAGSPPASRTSR